MCEQKTSPSFHRIRGFKGKGINTSWTCPQAKSSLEHFMIHPSTLTSPFTTMQHFNNQAENQLGNTAACELDDFEKGAWVNQAYSGSPAPIRRPISTIYNPQPMFHSSLENMNQLNLPNPYLAEDKVRTHPTEEKSGCCSFLLKAIKGKGGSMHFPIFHDMIILDLL